MRKIANICQMHVKYCFSPRAKLVQCTVATQNAGFELKEKQLYNIYVELPILKSKTILLKENM